MATPPPFTKKPGAANFTFDPASRRRLAVDRYDFEAHLDGYNPPYDTTPPTNFRHTADMIDMEAPISQVTITGIHPQNVQIAIELLAAGGGGGGGITITGTGLLHATGNTLDVNAYLGGAGQFLLTNAAVTDTVWTTLSQDVSNSTSVPGQLTVIGLRNHPISVTAPSVNGQMLTWTGSNWAPTSASPPSNGNVLTWNGSWGPAAATISINGSGVLHATNGVVNVNAYLGFAGQFLVTNAASTDTLWVTIGADVSASVSLPGQITVIGLQGSPISTTAPTANGQLLSWNGSVWLPSPASSPSVGNVLTWSSGGWVPGAGGGGGSFTPPSGYGFIHITGGVMDGSSSHGTQGQLPISTLVSGNQDSIWSNFTQDVKNSNTTPGQMLVQGLQTKPISTTLPTTNGQILEYKSGQWTPNPASPVATTSDQLMRWSGSDWIPSPSTGGIVSGNILTWNGTDWVAASAAGGSITATGSGFLHITATSSSAVGTLDGNSNHGTAGQYLLTNTSVGNPDTTWTTLTQDAISSVSTPGQITVQGLQTHLIATTAPTGGQFLIYTAGGTNKWGPLSLSASGDVTASTSTPGLLTVIGIQNNPVATPTGSDAVLSWNTGAAPGVFSWDNAMLAFVNTTPLSGATANSKYSNINLIGGTAITISGTKTASRADITINSIGATSLAGDVQGTVSGNVINTTLLFIDNVSLPPPSGSNTVLTYNAPSTPFQLTWVTPSGGGGGSPTGSAGGDLTGSTYPNPYVSSIGGSGNSGSIVSLNTNGFNYTLGGAFLFQYSGNNRVQLTSSNTNVNAPTTVNLSVAGTPIVAASSTTVSVSVATIGMNSGIASSIGTTTAATMSLSFNNVNKITLTTIGSSGDTVAISTPFMVFTGGSGGYVGTQGGQQLDLGTNLISVVRIGTSQTVGIGTPAVSFTELTVQAQAGSNNAINAISSGTGAAVIANASSGSGIGLSASSTSTAVLASSSGSSITVDVTSNGSGDGFRSRALGGGTAIVASSVAGAPAIVATCDTNTCISATSNGRGMFSTTSNVGNQAIYGSNTGGGIVLFAETTANNTALPAGHFANHSTLANTQVIRAVSGIITDSLNKKYVDCFSHDGATEHGWLGSNAGANVFGAWPPSDKRLKENIKDNLIGIDTLNKIKVRNFNFKKDLEKNVMDGFIAQELHKVYPRAVSKGDKENVWAVCESALTPLVIKSIQDVSKENKEIKKHTSKEVVELKKYISKLEKRILKLEKKK